jgi:hypothetical protein
MPEQFEIFARRTKKPLAQNTTVLPSSLQSSLADTSVWIESQRLKFLP